MKRLEIIIGTYELPKAIDILEEVDVSGYTVISDTAGKGKRGKRIKDEITEVNRRSIIICVDEEARINKVIEKLKVLKQRYSLKAFVSDVIEEL